MSQTTRVTHIVNTLTERIGSGVYPINSKLPGVRVVAEEFNVSSATAHSAYRELERAGLVRNEPRVGTFVNRQRPTQPATAAIDLQASLARWIQDARRIGHDRQFLTKMFEEQLAEAYTAPIPQIIFVECNRHDAHTVARRASRTLGIDVIPLLVDELGTWLNGQQHNCRSIFITTTYYHLSEVKEIAAPFGHTPIGLHHVPSQETAAKIADLPEGIHLGAVATNRRTLERLVALATMYHGTPQSEALVDDAKALEKMRRQADIILDTFSCHEQVIQGLEQPERAITVQFTISENSLLALRDKVRAASEPASLAPSLERGDAKVDTDRVAVDANK